MTWYDETQFLKILTFALSEFNVTSFKKARETRDKNVMSFMCYFWGDLITNEDAWPFCLMRQMLKIKLPKNIYWRRVEKDKFLVFEVWWYDRYVYSGVYYPTTPRDPLEDQIIDKIRVWLTFNTLSKRLEPHKHHFQRYFDYMRFHPDSPLVKRFCEQRQSRLNELFLTPPP